MSGAHAARPSALLVTWLGGGNLPPLLASAQLLRKQGHEVAVLGSSATRPAAAASGFPTLRFRRVPDPRVDVPFEEQAASLMTTAAGLEAALDVRDAIALHRPTIVVADCMVPAAFAAAEATGARVVSLVHFPYGLAREELRRGHGAWTTDRATLDRTRVALGLQATRGALHAWEAVDLLLVTAPPWFDRESSFPSNVLHAGPLGVRATARDSAPPGGQEPLLLVALSTTALHGQAQLLRRICAALAALDVRALVTLGGLSTHDLGAVGPNVTTVPFADHDDVLPSCAALVTHGGLGTTLRALAHGVPIVAAPLGRDQHFNARRVVELGVGVAVDPVSAPGEIAHAVRSVLEDTRYRRAARGAARAIAAADPDAAAGAALSRVSARPVPAHAS